MIGIAEYVKNSNDIDELSFRQYVDADYNTVSHLEKYLRLGHKKLWYYIEQCDYNLYYAENQIYTRYRDFQKKCNDEVVSSKASLNDNTSCSYVHCEKCGATGESFNMSKKYSSDEKAAEAWNRRADNGKIH